MSCSRARRARRHLTRRRQRAVRRVRAALAGHSTVLLQVDPQIAWERVSRSQSTNGYAKQRPLARERGDFMDLHAARQPLYEELADAILAEPPSGAVTRAAGALRALAGAPSGTRLLWASAASGEYPVLVARGLLAEANRGSLEAIWPLDRSTLARVLRERRDRHRVVRRAPGYVWRRRISIAHRRAAQDAGRAPSSCGAG